MLSPDTGRLLFDLEDFIDDINVVGINFPCPNSRGFNWALQTLNDTDGIMIFIFSEIDGVFADTEAPKENCPKKRGRSECCGPSSSKACREKLRRDRLNDMFVELVSILEPGKPPKTDKVAILIDAVRTVTRLRGEAQKLKDSNSDLQQKIKELKAD